MPAPTLTQRALLQRALDAREWTRADLQRAIAGVGPQRTPQAVRVWVVGGGSRDEVKPTLMDLLGLDAEEFLRACALRRLDEPQGRKRTYRRKNLSGNVAREVHQGSSADGSAKPDTRGPAPKPYHE